MFLAEFQCKKCKEVQEVYLDNGSAENDESCKACGAKPEEMERVGSAIDKHLSWSKWNVGA